MAKIKKTAQSIPMTSTQAAIGGGVLIGFFALWFLWAAVGDEFIDWIGGKNNLSGWVQAIGSILAILGAALFPLIHHKIMDGKDQDRKKREARLYLIRIYPILKDFEDDVRTCAYRYIFALDSVGMQENNISELFSEFTEWFKQYENFLDDSLHARYFSIIPDLIGQRISYAIGKIKSIQLDVSRFDVDFYEKNNQRFESKLSDWRDELLYIADILRTVNILVETEARLIEIFPSNEEIYGEI
ncbi:hypothetical protein V8Z74_10415 [Comamonas sp. w2-DMI]|uniref:hypothetical protein n=1 Tax=Comamonas sp. w2-DMI TaxID=3126391 RepID=UPI0032E50978